MVLLVAAVAGAAVWATQLQQPQIAPTSPSMQRQLFGDSNAQAELAKLEVKGRAPKTGYARKQFGDGWGKIDGCSVREVILARDLTDEKIDEKCRVASGVLNDVYTGKTIHRTIRRRSVKIAASRRVLNAQTGFSPAINKS